MSQKSGDFASTTSDKNWIVIWTESRAEKKVAARLDAMALQPWLPQVVERHRWSDRWRNVVVPLFPGYLFARVPDVDLARVLRTAGVLTIVKRGLVPARVSDAFVASLKSAVDSGQYEISSVNTPVAFSKDDEVVVQEGPLSGLRGVVRELRGSRQLVVWIESVGRGLALTLDSSLVLRRAA